MKMNRFENEDGSVVTTFDGYDIGDMEDFEVIDDLDKGYNGIEDSDDELATKTSVRQSVNFEEKKEEEVKFVEDYTTPEYMTYDRVEEIQDINVRIANYNDEQKRIFGLIAEKKKKYFDMLNTEQGWSNMVNDKKEGLIIDSRVSEHDL